MVFKLRKIWRIVIYSLISLHAQSSLNSGTASNILKMFVQCEHKYWISGFLHQLITNDRWWGWGPDKRPEPGHRIQHSAPRRPNINSFVSAWWKSPLRQHFWPSEQLVNNEPSRYYWAIIKIFSSNEEKLSTTGWLDYQMISIRFPPNFSRQLKYLFTYLKGNGQFIFGSPKQTINYRVPLPLIMLESIELLKR